MHAASNSGYSSPQAEEAVAASEGAAVGSLALRVAKEIQEALGNTQPQESLINLAEVRGL